MSSWDKWSEIRAAVRDSSTRAEALGRVSQIRKQQTTWDALARQWRRMVDAGQETGEAHTALKARIVSMPSYGGNVSISLDRGVTAEELDSATLKLPTEKGRGVGGKPTLHVDPAEGERWLIPGDIHFGIQDSVSLSLMQECAEDYGIKGVVLQGDTFDCYAISRHDQRADRVRGRCYTLAEEREEGRSFMDWCRRFSTRLIPGNHEDRLWAVQDKNPGLYGSLDLRTVFDIPQEIEVLPQFSRIQAGSLVVEHGHKLPGSLARYGEYRVLRDHPDQTTVYGHTHRIAEARQTTYDRSNRPRTRAAMTIGHLSVASQHVDYAPDANWQQGFALVEFWRSKDNKPRYTINVVEIHDHEFSFNGKVYR